MSYVRNAWYVAGWSKDLADDQPMAISILDDPVVLYRTSDGRAVALEDRCVHRLAPLSLGRCEGDALRCMYHGLLFGPDGAVIEIPGQEIVPPRARVRSYPVVDRHSWLWVWMGDADAADPALIPPAVGLDHPDFVLGHGQLDYAAEARLINDNLLDFSHLSYVHANSFGATETFARNRPKITPIARGVRVERWIVGEAGVSNSPFKRDPGSDRWSTYDFLIPGILLMTGGSFPGGTAEKWGFGPPDLADATTGVSFTSQAVTPLTATTSRYLFSWGPRADCGGEEQRDLMMKVAGQAFAEDKVMIEAQQRSIDSAPDARIMPTTHDKGVILFNRMVEALVRQEREGSAQAA